MQEAAVFGSHLEYRVVCRGELEVLRAAAGHLGPRAASAGAAIRPAGPRAGRSAQTAQLPGLEAPAEPKAATQKTSSLVENIAASVLFVVFCVLVLLYLNNR